MPANKKHLNKHWWQRLNRILAGTLAGYAVMLSFHILLTAFFPKQNVIATSFFTGYICWALLLLWAFIAKNPWLVWITYIGLTLIFLFIANLLHINLTYGSATV